jgi:hypothetical protein
MTDNGSTINFTAFPGILYRLQASTNLSSWFDLETNGPFDCSTTLCRLVNTQGSDHWFYQFLLQ